MKIGCHCGETIFDQTDNLPHKAHVIPDQEFFDVLEAIDDAIENSGPTAHTKEAACMRVRGLIGRIARQAWQCQACGRIYLDDRNHELREFRPGAEDVPREMFRSRS